MRPGATPGAVGRTRARRGRPRALLLLLGLALLPLRPAPAAGAEVGLAEGRERLRQVRELLASSEPRVAELRAAVDGLVEAYNEPAAAPVQGPEQRAHDAARSAFEREVHAVLLDALLSERTTGGSDTNLRHAVQVHVARALDRVDLANVHAFLPTVTRRLFDQGAAERSAALYEHLFHAVARHFGDEGFAWLLAEAIHPDATEDRARRTEAALREMGDWPAPVPGRLRKAAVDRLIDVFQSYEYHWGNKLEAVAGFRGGYRRFKQVASSSRPYWMHLRPILFETMRRLGTDPLTAEVPRTPEGEELGTIAEWGNWNFKRPHLKRAPWYEGDPAAMQRALPDVADRPVRPLVTNYGREFGAPWTERWRRIRPDVRLLPEDPPEMQAFRAALRTTWLPPLLDRVAEDAAPEVRGAALVLRARLGGEGLHLALLTRLVTDPSPRVREAAAIALLLAPPDAAALAPLRGIATDRDQPTRLRALALLALGVHGDLDTLLRAFVGDDAMIAADPPARTELRAAAIRALAFLPLEVLSEDVEAIVLGWLLRARASGVVRAAAGATLADLGTTRSRDGVLRLLADVRPKGDEVIAQMGAALAARRAIDAADAPGLAVIARYLERSRGMFGAVRGELAWTLARIGGDEARDILAEAWARPREDTTRPVERGTFLTALGVVGGARADAALREARREQEHELDRGAALLASALDGSARTFSSDEVEAVRQARFELIGPGLLALARVGDPRAGDLLAEALERESHGDVIEHAAWAHAALEGAAAAPHLADLWRRAKGPGERDAIAWCWRQVPGPEALRFLMGVATASAEAPADRALALLALGRMAAPPDEDPLARFAEHVVPYAHAPTLAALARSRDAAFLE